MTKLYVPGVAEYSVCKSQFELAEELLEDKDKNKSQLTRIKQTLQDNPLGVDFLAAELGEKFDDVLTQLTELSNYSGLERLTIDGGPAKFGEKMTQTKWMPYFNDQGKPMASMGDYYQNFKLIKKLSEEGTDQDKAIAQRYLSSLRDDFDWPGQKNWLVSSTRVEYNENNLQGKIIQHYQSHSPSLTKDTELMIRVYRGAPITNAISDANLLQYLQTLLNTSDDIETITDVLGFISGKSRTDIKVWSAGTSDMGLKYDRKNTPNRAAGFVYDSDDFHVDGGSSIDYPGRSRGVDISTVGAR